MSQATSPRAPGVGLGIAGQATLMGAWLVGVLGAVSGDDLGLVAGVAGVLGLVLTIVACFLLRSRWGAFGPIAGAILSAGVLGAIIAYIAVPGTSGWGKLGALILAMMILIGTFVIGHLIASVGLVRAGVTSLGGGAIAAQAASAIVLLTAWLGDSELWWLACLTTFVGHVLLAIGLFVMGQRDATDP